MGLCFRAKQVCSENGLKCFWGIWFFLTGAKFLVDKKCGNVDY
jgi:hypothetical protein